MEVHFTPELEAKLTHSATTWAAIPMSWCRKLLRVISKRKPASSRPRSAARKFDSEANILPMSKSAIAFNVFYSPDGSPLVVARGGSFGAHLLLDERDNPQAAPAVRPPGTGLGCRRATLGC